MPDWLGQFPQFLPHELRFQKRSCDRVAFVYSIDTRGGNFFVAFNDTSFVPVVVPVAIAFSFCSQQWRQNLVGDVNAIVPRGRRRFASVTRYARCCLAAVYNLLRFSSPFLFRFFHECHHSYHSRLWLVFLFLDQQSKLYFTPLSDC